MSRTLFGAASAPSQRQIPVTGSKRFHFRETEKERRTDRRVLMAPSKALAHRMDTVTDVKLEQESISVHAAFGFNAVKYSLLSVNVTSITSHVQRLFVNALPAPPVLYLFLSLSLLGTSYRCNHKFIKTRLA